MIVDFMKKADIKTDYFFFILTCGYGYEVSLGHAEVSARERACDGSGHHKIKRIRRDTDMEKNGINSIYMYDSDGNLVEIAVYK